MDNYIFSNKAWLAPLAGFSDLAFRILCRQFGAGFCFTEMVSAKGLIYNQKATFDILNTNEEDSPLGIQLFGEEPEVMYEATKILVEKGHRIFDCNMGCSVPKVIKTGAGAALLKDQERAANIIKSMVKAGEDLGIEIKVGAKIRLGFQDEIYKDLCEALTNSGVSWLTLHPRTAKQGFSGVAKWQALAELKEIAKVPVIASGDLWTAEDGVRCIKETGVDNVMYARGALRDPHIFAKHEALLENKEISFGLKDLYNCIMSHAELAKKYCNHKQSLLKMRTAIPRYAKYQANVAELRQAIIMCKDWEEFEKIINDYFTEKLKLEN